MSLPAEQFRASLITLLGEEESLERGSAQGWRLRASRTLALGLGSDHDLVKKFDATQWIHKPVTSFGRDTLTAEVQQRRDRAFANARRTSRTIIETALYESGMLHPHPVFRSGDIDGELWAHIHGEIERSEWGKVALNSAVFLEDWLRNRGSLPKTTIGTDLAKTTIGSGGVLSLTGQLVGGDAPAASEAQGWAQLGQGFFMAVRNVVGHRIDQRPDIQAYAMGVAGVVSLLMTQVRAEHP
jgi:Protein of unknown function (Hypoth_ymh)